MRKQFPNISSFSNKNAHVWVVLVALFYIVLNSFLIAKEFYFLSLLPAALFMGYVYFTAMDKAFLFIAFITPLSVNISDYNASIGVSLPGEPLLAGLLFMFIIKFITDRSFDKRIFVHPISFAIYFYLIWMLITSITSSHPMVSFKYFLARLWFIIPMYFLGVMVFKKAKNISSFVWGYAASLALVSIYYDVRLVSFGFDEKAAQWLMQPFYNDHTVMGAILAMFTVAMFVMIFRKDYSRLQKILTVLVTLVLFVTLIYSTSRAALASLAAAFGVYFLIVFRVKWWVVVSGGGLVVGLFLMFQSQIIMDLEQNRQDSSDDFVENVQSMSNIATDASNLERINRWKSAIRMFEERPFFGWGPGTYQFVYAPFQNSQDRTIISTNSGNLGNAHSEYIGPLSEQGVLGMISMLVLVLMTIVYAVRLIKYAESSHIRLLAMMLLFSLMTYFAHGLFNNFLDGDKASVPFWAFVAGIVSMDIYQKKLPTKGQEKLPSTE